VTLVFGIGSAAWLCLNRAARGVLQGKRSSAIHLDVKSANREVNPEADLSAKVTPTIASDNGKYQASVRVLGRDALSPQICRQRHTNSILELVAAKSRGINCKDLVGCSV